MIYQLAQVIAKVLHLNALRQPAEALDEIQRCSKQLLGMDLRLLTTLSDEELIRLLSLGDRFDVEKCVAAAELLRLTGTVKDLQCDEPAAYRCTTTSLSLFLELLFRETETLPREYYEQVDELARGLSSYDHPLKLQKKLFRYYGVVGSYAAAEDLLFAIVEQEEGFVPEGIRFYEGLLRKSDEALVAGNLPRDEVHAGLVELLKRTQ